MRNLFRTLIVFACGLAAAPSVTAGDDAVLGVWDGTYVCAQGPTHVLLEIWREQNGDLTARYNFNSLPGLHNNRPGAAIMHVTVRGDRVDLTPLGWERQPGGYGLITVAMRIDGDRMSGHILNRGCGGIDVSRTGGSVSQAWSPITSPRSASTAQAYAAPHTAAAAPQPPRGLPDPDTGAVTSANAVKTLSVSLGNIDDLGAFMVFQPGGKLETAVGAEWTVQNQGGSARGSLNAHLKTGDNIVVFLLHNKFWLGGSRSKWAFNASLSADGRVLWQDSRLVRNMPSGIMYWKAFHVVRGGDGKLSVEGASADQLAAIRPRMAAFNQNLMDKYGDEHTAGELLVTAFAAAMIDGMVNGNPNAGTSQPVPHTPRPCYDYAAPNC